MPLIKHIKASNILSFGPDGLDLPLGNLNVLIGANGSGKSNFIELFALLRSLPRSSEETTNNLQGVIRRGGGFSEWVWKGNAQAAPSVEALLPKQTKQDYHHKISFRAEAQRFQLLDEAVLLKNHSAQSNLALYSLANGGGTLTHKLDSKNLPADNSILSQRRDPDVFPEFSFISTAYEKIRLYREWNFGRSTIFREPQKADLRNDRLEEDFSNLGLYLNQIGRHPQAKRQLVNALCDLYEGLEGYEVLIEGGTVQVFFTEGNFTIPATRLSDGSLRYLCLLAILLDPTPPPLICIEEPELGMHPDMLPKIADLLKDAAQRTQLIVTTHSDILVDAMTDQPESVLVCEKHDGQTLIKRLNPDEINSWLEQYRLGQLWSRGEIGGNRW